MAFNSITFLIFFASFFLLYWLVFNRNKSIQNKFLLFGNYLFYGWADWRLLLLIIGISVLNYLLGIQIEKTNSIHKKKVYKYIGLVQGVGGLAIFKYYNFFITSINECLNLLNLKANLNTLNIIIPLGISFFTFRTISYILDVYNEKVNATKDWVVFFNYISFFPTIFSGPIDRAKLFFPQLEKERTFEYKNAVDGLRQVLWGLFKKIVIADNCSIITTQIFNTDHNISGSTILLGAILYTFQIYADFSGYSDMAIGFSKTLGFNIPKNFAYPLFSQNIAEFWRKWHISLTSWVGEYVFTPLSISLRKYNKLGLIIAIIINFLIIGIWHGPNHTYILFGLIHGCLFIPLILQGTFNKNSKIASGKLLPSLRETINILVTFTLVMLTLILFRSENMLNASNLYFKLFSISTFTIPDIPNGKLLAFTIIPFLTLMLITEWVQREKEYGLQIDNIQSPIIRWAIYYTLILAVQQFSTNNVKFIYAQF